MWDTLSNWDIQSFELINEHWRNDVLDDLMPMLSSDPLFWGLVVGALLTYVVLQGRGGLRRLPLPALFLLLSLGVSDVTANVAKSLNDRPRPVNTLPGVYYRNQGQWEQNPADFVPRKSRNVSFYSSHAANSMAAVATLAAIVPQTAPLIYILPLGVGWSRVYVGKHYPSDVLVGWLAGLLVGKGTGKAYQLTAARLRRRLREKARNGCPQPAAVAE